MAPTRGRRIPPTSGSDEVLCYARVVAVEKIAAARVAVVGGGVIDGRSAIRLRS
jgi:hypothetical protein